MHAESADVLSLDSAGGSYQVQQLHPLHEQTEAISQLTSCGQFHFHLLKDFHFTLKDFHLNDTSIKEELEQAGS